MLKEIHEQPEALRQSILGRVDRDDRIGVAELDPLLPILEVRPARGARRLRDRLLRGAGRRRGAPGLDRPAGARQRGLGVPLLPPPLDGETLVIAVTQSGETADTIAPTRYAREQGCPVIAVTNTVGSAITREADAVLFLQAGPEIAVAASKTFVTQVTTLVVLAAAIAKARGTMGVEQELELGAALRALPEAAAKALANARAGARDLARRYVNSRGLHVRRAAATAIRRRWRGR